jgi:hypothetical protein
MHRDQLLALEAVDHEVRCFCKVQVGELLLDCIQSFDGADVVVLV